jgi:hypothetical protein
VEKGSVPACGRGGWVSLIHNKIGAPSKRDHLKLEVPLQISTCKASVGELER